MEKDYKFTDRCQAVMRFQTDANDKLSVEIHSYYDTH